MKYKDKIGEGILIVVGQIFGSIGILLSVHLITNELGTEEYGKLSLILSLAVLLGQVGYSWALPGIPRFFSIARDLNDVQSYFKTSFYLFIKSTGIVLILTLLMSYFLSYIHKNISSFAFILAVCSIVLDRFNLTHAILQNVARKRFVLFLQYVLDPFFKVVIFILFSNQLIITAESVLLVYFLAGLILFFIHVTILRKSILRISSFQSNRQNWSNKITSFSRPFFLISFITWLHTASDRWILESFTSMSEVGIYVALFQLSYFPMTLLTGMALNYFTPFIYDNNQKTVLAESIFHNLKIIKYVILLLISVSLISYLFRNLFFSLVVSEQFLSGANYWPIMLFSGGLFSFGQYLALKFESDLKTEKMILPKFLSSLFGITLNFLGVFFGGLGGLVFSQLLFSILNLILIAKWSGISFNRI